MIERRIPASQFKATCLALLDEVERTHEEIVITKRGRPIARLAPLERSPGTMGSVTLLSDDDDDFFSSGLVWDASA